MKFCQGKTIHPGKEINLIPRINTIIHGIFLNVQDF